MTLLNSVLVVGSSNVDMVIHSLSSLPVPGETIGGGRFSIFNGGKGANQAVAASKAGAAVSFITCLGEGVFADSLITSFKNDGIDVTYVYKIQEESTGTALIMVNKNGENCIAVASGANAKLNKNMIDSSYKALENSNLIMLQMEIPLETIEYVIKKAHFIGKKIILNCAPAKLLSDSILSCLDYLVVNETEAELMSGKKLELGKEKEIADYFLAKNVKHVIITLGTAGSFVASKEGSQYIPAFKVTVVDTTGAGDTYCGALAAALCNGKSLYESVQFASAAAAISVTREGAQISAPKLDEINSFLHTHSL